MRSTVTHKTGYLYQDNGSLCRAPSESWHRTFRGALKAKERNDNNGYVYKLLSDDQSERVA